MRKFILSGFVVTALAGLLLVPASAMTTPKLNGTVGPGFTITLTKGGKKVTSLKAGKYTFVIHDKATAHNFTLEEKGGHGRTLTATAFMGTKTITVTLSKGTWKYYCSVHESVMFGFFKVS